MTTDIGAQIMPETWPVELDSCVASDAMDVMGIVQTDAGMRPLWEGAKIAGPVLTVQLAEGAAPAGQPKVHLGVNAITAARPGQVIVMANDGRTTMGSWGGLLSRAALAHSVAGVVLHGAARDVDEARELAFPVFGLDVTPRTARGRVHEVSCGEPVQIGELLVRTGDWVVADGSGVVFIPTERFEEVRALALQLAYREKQMILAIADDQPLAEVLGANYEDMASASGEGQVR